ncbi:MAG: hypothetical protein HY554_17515 [Elusimicrobia bacterium]|nr:hypothetical protein [Elusimicrobiota bacterium]
MKFLSAFSHKALALSLALSLPAATWAGVARAPAAPAAAAAPIAPTAILSAHHQVFTSPGSLQPLFQQWSAERTQASLPDAERLARELILRAASAPSLAAAGRAIFSAPLAPAPQQMAAEIVLQVRGEMRSNPTLRKAVERAAAELWKGGSASQTDEAIAKAGAFRDLERVLEAWKPKQDGLERIGALAPAALAWREAYAGEPGVRGALLPADWDAAGSGGGSAEAGGGRGWSGKRGVA